MYARACWRSNSDLMRVGRWFPAVEGEGQADQAGLVGGSKNADFGAVLGWSLRLDNQGYH